MPQRVLTIFFACFISLFTTIYTGVLEGELIKTTRGLIPVEHIKVGDGLYSYNNQNNLVSSTVTHIYSTVINKIYVIELDKGILLALPHQQFYDPVARTWVYAKNITQNSILLDAQLEHHHCCNCYTLNSNTIKVYYLSVTQPHNFFVSKSEILTHNGLPLVALGLTWAFGSGIEFVGISACAAVASWFGIQLHKKHKEPHIKVDIVSQSSGGGKLPEDPDEKKQKRDEAIKNRQHLTNKEARIKAKKLGYKKVKDHPCGNTRNQDVFTNGRNYISPDIDGHNGGFWKVFSRKGIIQYSMDRNLKNICKTY